jgi:hypothetical protein
MTKKVFKSLLISCFIILLPINGITYDSDNVHPEINEKASRQAMNLEKILKDLGFNKGVDSIVNNKEIYKWFREGGTKEDSPIWRANNHFHDPLKTWDKAGLDSYVIIPTIPPSIYYVNGKSSLLWAQNQSSAGFLYGGDWSWSKARSLYYEALTAKDNDTKEQKLTDTFRALGQIMHLIADSSVPAHVRNDIHVFPLEIPGLGISVGRPTYESWTKSNYRNLNYTGITVNQSIFNDAVNLSLAKVPISALWDQDKYNSTNPEVTVGGSIGITEYTNANFFSEDTINSKNYPYPRIDGNTPIVGRTYTSASGQIYTREYYLKNCCGETKGGEGYLLSVVDFLDYYRQKYPLLSFALPKIPVLDENVYADYASFLIPRAVGYSAGLLDYFFRGELYVTLLVPSNDGVAPDTWGNQSDTGTDIDTVSVLIQNNSKLGSIIEPIGAGTLTLTVSYTDLLTGDTIYESAGSISVTSIPAKDSGSYLNAVFTFIDPIEARTAEDITYYLAFRGQLGNETDAVIGRVIKAPILYNVFPDEGTEGTVITLTGNNLPVINGPFPTTSEDIRFQHDLTKPYIVEVINKTDTDIIVKVPNMAGLIKPGYGGLRVRNILDTGEKIYSNPVSFFPIAEGVVNNIGDTTVNVTVEAIGPIVGDYALLPETIIIESLPPGVSQPIQLMTGFTYTATANKSVTKDIESLTPDIIDFVFEVE